MLALVVLTVVAGAADGAAATSNPVVTVNVTAQAPAPSVPVALSSSSQTTYVSLQVSVTSDPTNTNTLTHVTLIVPAPGNGAAVVYTDCPGATFDGGGFSCSLGSSLPGGQASGRFFPGQTSPRFHVVLQTPTAGSTMTVNPTVTFDERSNDQNRSHTDTYSNPQTWRLTSDTTSRLDSYTKPNAKTTLRTDPRLRADNPKSTQVTVPPTPFGVLVSVKERNLRPGECPTAVTDRELTCVGQISDVTIGGTFPCAPLTSPCPTALNMVFTYSGASLGEVDVDRFVAVHETEKNPSGEVVPRCSTCRTDSAGDCILSITQDPTTGDIRYVAQGPSQGGWGGAE